MGGLSHWPGGLADLVSHDMMSPLCGFDDLAKLWTCPNMTLAVEWDCKTLTLTVTSTNRVNRESYILKCHLLKMDAMLTYPQNQLMASTVLLLSRDLRIVSLSYDSLISRHEI